MKNFHPKSNRSCSRGATAGEAALVSGKAASSACARRIELGIKGIADAAKPDRIKSRRVSELEESEEDMKASKEPRNSGANDAQAPEAAL